jgi:dolichol-phosphate mannosyltransferase
MDAVDPFATDGILFFSIKPLRLASTMGFVTSGLEILGILYALVLRLWTSNWVSGWMLLIISVLFLGGVQLICFGHHWRVRGPNLVGS